MRDNYIYYEYDGERYKVPFNERKQFESLAPDAKIQLTYDGENYKVPLNELDSFVNTVGDISSLSFSSYKKDDYSAKGSTTPFSFLSQEEVVVEEPAATQDNKPSFWQRVGESMVRAQNEGFDIDVDVDKEDTGEDKTSIFETIGKATGAAGTTIGKWGVDAVNTGAKMGRKRPTYGNPLTGLGATIEAITGKSLFDKEAPLNQASEKMEDTIEKLSLEADPTHGEMGYGELLKEGKVGMAAQKALASGIESLPIMIGASTGPIGMTIMGVGMAASNYADEERENPEVEDWKRGMYAIGTAVTELAVERLGGPLNKLFGKGGQLTKEALENAITQIRKEGIKTLKERILGVLKNIGKEGLEEGGEELLTSFGNDALGEALDAIEGNKDYGIRAQWAKYKEQNPDATVEDFANAKVNEYSEAFLGGFLSGAEISGVSTTANEVTTNRHREQMDEARVKGTTLGLSSMYDLDEAVKEQADAAETAFTNDAGEKLLSRELIDNMSAEDAFELSLNEDFSNSQKIALRQLANAKAMEEGLTTSLDNSLTSTIDTQKAHIEKAAENGKIVIGIANEQPVYVKGAVVQNGSLTLPTGENGPVIIINAVTGEESSVNTNEITNFASRDAAEYAEWVEAKFMDKDHRDRQTARTTMSVGAKLKAVTPYAGKKMYVDFGNGLIEVGVQRVLPTGEVIIQGKKGDLGGQSIKTIGVGAFYDSIYRDENGNPMFVEGELEPVEEQTTEGQPTTEQPSDVNNVNDYREQTVEILINGKPVSVDVISQDNTANRITYEYVDENGNTRTGGSTISEFESAIQQASQYQPAPEAPVVEEPAPEEPQQQVVEEEPTPQAPEEIPVTPETIDWDALFEQDPEAYFIELQNQFGEEAMDILNEEIAAAQSELDALAKAKTKSQNERLENRKKKAGLQNRINILNGMITRLTPAPEVVAETPVEEAPAPVEEAPVAETPVEEVPAEPETPSATTDGGFVFENGVAKNPLVLEMPEAGEHSSKIFLAEKDGKWGYGVHAELDNGTNSSPSAIQEENLRYNSKEDAIAAALSYFDMYKNMKANSGKSTTAMDAFIQYVKDTYLKGSEPSAPEVVTPEPVVPVAPNPVDDPIQAAKDREKILTDLLERRGLTFEFKADAARNAGREVADMFATREAYDEYLAEAAYLGEFETFFNEGVEDSFAARNKQQNTGETPVNSVPLEEEPKGENNGEQGNGEVGTGQHTDSGVQGTSDGEGQGDDKGNQSEKGSKSQGKNNKGKKKVGNKYPARKGNVTGQDLIDTFGFASVTIPNKRTTTLNTIYDFMMEMAKMLGISPKSIGHGGWLTVSNLKENSNAVARHELSYDVLGNVVDASLKYKYADLRSIAHEWWHSLDYVLQYFNTGKITDITGYLTGPTSEVSDKNFSGRKEVLDAVRDVIKAIKESGHEQRIIDISPAKLSYWISPREMSARAFEAYIQDKFAKAGIVIDGTSYPFRIAQPTAEEMAIIAPAFDKLFEVLQEKEGKTPGTSVLFQIGEMVDKNTEASQLATENIINVLRDSKIEVVKLTNENVEQMIPLSKVDGTIYGWTDGKKIYLTEAGINPNTPIHEYTHLWAKAMMQNNPKGWQSVKDLLRGTAIWDEVMNDTNYSNIHNDEDAVASEALSRISGRDGAAKMEQMAQQMIDDAKGTARKLEARGLIQRMKDALNEFWSWVGTNLFKIEKFDSIEQVTDRVLWDLLNATDLGELNEGNVELQAFRKYEDRSRNNIAKEPNQEFRNEVAYEIMRMNFQHSGQDVVFANNKAYLVSHPESAELGVSAGYSIEKVLDLSYLSDEQRKEAKELLANYNGDWGAVVVSIESMWPRSGRIDSNLRILNNRRSEGNDGLLDDRQGSEGITSERGDGSSDGDSGHSGIGSWTKTVYDGSRERRIVYRDELDLEDGSWDDLLFRSSDSQNAAVDNLVGEARLRAIEHAVNAEASKLGVKVTYKTREQMPKGHHNEKGYYNPNTGEIVVCTENASSIADAIQTILHEAVAHKGLRQLMGDKFNEFINRVYESLDAETKAKVDARAAAEYGGDTAVAMEEYMATLAESTDFNNNTLWDKIKSIFEDIINAILGRNDIKIGDNELRYILRASYNNMVNPRGMETVRGWAQDQMMREDYGVNLTPAAQIAQMDAEYMRAVREGDMETAQRLVNEAAKIAMPNTTVVDENGNPKVVYHGTPNEFFVFGEDLSGKRSHTEEGSYYFNDNPEVAATYGERVIPAFVNIENPLVEDFEGRSWRNLTLGGIDVVYNRTGAVLQSGFATKEEAEAWREQFLADNPAYAKDADYVGVSEGLVTGVGLSSDEYVRMAMEAGNDGAILNNITDSADLEHTETVVNDYVAFSSRQVKSAEPVTYDDEGNVIPLSKRFNLENDDIRYRTGIDPTEEAAQTAKEVYDNAVQDNWQEFQRQFQDAMQPVRIAIDAIQQETGNVPIEDYENYILIQNQASSRSRVEIDEFHRKYYSPIIEQVNAIIDKIMKARGYKINDKKRRAEVYAEVKQYLIAKHGLERNAYYQSTKTKMVDGEEVPDMRDYSGLTTLFGMSPRDFEAAEAAAQECVDKFEAEVGDATDALWKKINAATSKTLRHSYECGIISRQQYEDINGMFDFYIPLRGFDETTAEDVYTYARFEGNRFSAAVKTAKGRTSLANDPIAYIMNMAESEIAQGNKNRAKQALYHFILNRPVTDADGNQTQNSLMQVENVWYVKSVDGFGREVYTIAHPDHAAGETMQEFEAKMKALAETGEAVKSKKGKVDVGMRFQKPTHANEHYIYLKVNGVEKAIYVNGNPKAAQAVNGTFAEPLEEGAQRFRDVQRALSQTFTNYSIEFTARNYMRDLIYSHINIGVRESDPAYRRRFRQNWRKNNLGTMLKLIKAYRAGELEGRQLTEVEAAFVEFMANGGQTGYTLINSIEAHKRDLERAIENMQKGVVNGGVKDSTIFKFTLGNIELLNEASELVTRFAAFKTSRDMGRSIARSISDAKEVTVNFNTRGAQDGKGWMGVVARYLGWSKFFFNASVQGVQNITAMAKANKLKFCGVVGGVAATGFMMPLLTGVIYGMLSGDDDDEKNPYWNIPEYERQNNICIVIGDGKYVKIPLPIGFREIYALGDMTAALVFDKTFKRDATRVGVDMANKIASVVLPINPLEGSVNGLSLWHTALNTGLPSSLQFVVQNATNIDWKGAPIQKEYQYNKDDPQWMKAFSSNPDWMVGLSKWCNEHIGTGDMKGMDWSPEKLDNTLSNLFGGIYSLVKKTGNSFSMIWNEENRNLSNIPLAGVILGSGADSDDRYMTNEYYDGKEYYDDRIGFIERRAKEFGYDLDDVFNKEKGKQHPKMHEIYGNKEYEFMKTWYLGHEGNPNGKSKQERYGLNKLHDNITELEKRMKQHPNPLGEERLQVLNREFEKYQEDFVKKMIEVE